ncbi:hypothetical protein IJS18_00755 [Candidatus Saccharibacteria bacterium]|nr:hypothetical protein [Candidatus Saccharibacteria bacterium]
MSKLAEAMSKFDINEIEDFDHGSHATNLHPIIIVPIVFVIVLIVGFIIRLMARGSKEAIKKADIIMLVGLLGAVISGVIILIIELSMQ